MAYFATFYSYKGGVGRTLALGNVAWLLANHLSEPARVLAIDFDLGAPGLFQVLKMSNPERSSGVVDYVTDYLRNAEIPDVRRFIHKSAYDRIDILPAGRMDADYQKRLEAIDWKALYEDAFGYELFEKLKSQITAITPEYDYVLIDSLTGFSDVGGICVNQLPDSVILLFRLNQQNLDGISRVYHKASAGNADSVRKAVIPVITPSWPFLDEAASPWIDKAQHVFAGIQLLEISFDSSLSFGEKIVSEKATKLPLTAKIVLDYKNLTSQLRKTNPTDCLTIWNKIQHPPYAATSDWTELYLALLKRRPTTSKYWEPLQRGYHLEQIHGRPKASSDAMDKLLKFVDDEADHGNKFALLARAGVHRGKKSSSQVREDLEKAIQIDPHFVAALEARANLAVGERHFDDAVQDLSACLEVVKSESLRWRLQLKLADIYLQMFDGKAALNAVASLSGRHPTDPELHAIRARAFYLVGDYPSALTEARHSARLNISIDPSLLLPSQILAAMGQLEEASEELTRVARENPISKNNLAEAYLAVDPMKTIEVLKKDVATEPFVRTLLTCLAHIFLGEEVPFLKTQPLTSVVSWSFFEIVALIRAKQAAGALTPDAVDLAYGALRQAATPEEFKFMERLRRSM